MENLHRKSPEVNEISEKKSKIDIEFTCAFYDKCSLPKNDALCNHFPNFMICPDYKVKRSKILEENNNKK